MSVFLFPQTHLELSQCLLNNIQWCPVWNFWKTVVPCQKYPVVSHLQMLKQSHTHTQFQEKVRFFTDKIIIYYLLGYFTLAWSVRCRSIEAAPVPLSPCRPRPSGVIKHTPEDKVETTSACRDTHKCRPPTRTRTALHEDRRPTSPSELNSEYHLRKHYDVK